MACVGAAHRSILTLTAAPLLPSAVPELSASEAAELVEQVSTPKPSAAHAQPEPDLRKLYELISAPSTVRLRLLAVST